MVRKWRGLTDLPKATKGVVVEPDARLRLGV